MLAQVFNQIADILSAPLFEIGETVITGWTIIYLIIIALFIIIFSRWVKNWVTHKLLVKTSMDLGDREATGIIIRYIMVILGVIIILQTTGIDLTILNVLAGTLGIGVGFGLQNIVNNFVSGLIILFERPVKVGDRIEVADVHGKVVHIGARSVSVVTNDNIAIIVPNQKFITENVINWSHKDEMRRFIIPVIVAADSDPYLVEKLLVEAAQEDPDVLDNPAPGVRLFGFGENGMNFELRAWSHSLIHRRGLLTSKLNFRIIDKFRDNNIELVIPQREVFVRQENPHTKAKIDD